MGDYLSEIHMDGNRQIRLVVLEIAGLASFQELVLTPAEEEKLNELKTFLVGMKVRSPYDAFNGTGGIGTIADVRMVVGSPRVTGPHAIVTFLGEKFSRLRALKDLENIKEIDG